MNLLISFSVPNSYTYESEIFSFYQTSIWCCKNKGEEKIPIVTPGRLGKPLEGSKKTSRDDEARSSNIEANAGGSNRLPCAI